MSGEPGVWRRQIRPTPADGVDVGNHGLSLSLTLSIQAALGLSLLVKTLETLGLPAYSTYLLTGLEFILLTVDVVAVLFYIVKQIKAHVKGSDDDDQDEGHNNGH